MFSNKDLMSDKLKQFLPNMAVVMFFISIALIYFYPVLEGKKLPQMDNTHSIGMAKELVDYEKDSGERSMWTNSMFGGMPAYQIRGDSSANLFSYLNRISRIGLPYYTIAIVFLYLLGFFILMRSLGFNFWLSTIGSVAFAFGSYNFIIIIAGHITKAYAIALMAPVIAGILYSYNKNKWGGALFTAIALGANIAYNHVQITYYLALLIFILLADRMIRAIRNKTFHDFIYRTALLLVAVILAILPNLTNLWTTWEYSKESIRGDSLLSMDEANTQQKGLDADYVFAWSYGKGETLSLMIPNFNGGRSRPIGEDPELLANMETRISDELIANGLYMGEQHGQFVKQLVNEVTQQPKYWGSKPFTEGPVYVGALVCFLFVLGLFFYKGKEKWWLLAGTLLSIILAWGKNLEGFNMFMYNYFPLYNKFRTVEMALVIASFTIPLMALLTLREIVEEPEILKEKSGYFLSAVLLTAGVSAIFYFFPNILKLMSDFEIASISEQKMNNPDQAVIFDVLMQEIKYARMILLKTDSLRTIIFIILGSGSLWFLANGKISVKYIIPGLLVLILVDLWTVDRRYLNSSLFRPAREMRVPFIQNEADKLILEDKDLNFRVFSIYGSPFQEVNTSYFHKSLGGYHGAKLQRYQDIIDYYLQQDFQRLRSVFYGGTTASDIEGVLANLPVINMLNTKFIIYNPDMAPLRNPFTMGNAWFVEQIRTVESSQEEINALGEEDLNSTAIIHLDFSDILEKQTIGSGNGEIKLTEYKPDYLQYTSQTSSPSFAVFSEIYYSAGWKAFINGKEEPIIRTNYLLRGLFIPEGDSIIEFKFQPASFKYGKIISGTASVLILLLIGLYFMKRKTFAAK